MRPYFLLPKRTGRWQHLLRSNRCDSTVARRSGRARESYAEFKRFVVNKITADYVDIEWNRWKVVCKSIAENGSNHFSEGQKVIVGQGLVVHTKCVEQISDDKTAIGILFKPSPITLVGFEFTLDLMRVRDAVVKFQ